MAYRPSLSDIAFAQAKIGPRATASMIARCIGASEIDVKTLMADPERAEVRKSPERIAAEAEKRRLEARDRQFVQMWNEGVQNAVIAQQFNVCRSSVTAWRKRLCLASRVAQSSRLTPWCDERDAVIRREYIVAGKTAHSVGKALGVSRCAVIGRAKRLGLARNASVNLEIAA